MVLNFFFHLFSVQNPKHSVVGVVMVAQIILYKRNVTEYSQYVYFRLFTIDMRFGFFQLTKRT